MDKSYMDSHEPDFHRIGRYGKNLADDRLFAKMAESVYSQFIAMGFSVKSISENEFPSLTENEFDQIIRAALTGRHKEIFQNQSNEEVSKAIDQQIKSGFGITAIHAIILSFSEHNIFFTKDSTDTMC